MPKVARSRERQSLGRGFFSLATKFSSLILRGDKRPPREREREIVMMISGGERILLMIYIASRILVQLIIIDPDP